MLKAKFNMDEALGFSVAPSLPWFAFSIYVMMSSLWFSSFEELGRCLPLALITTVWGLGPDFMIGLENNSAAFWLWLTKKLLAESSGLTSLIVLVKALLSFLYLLGSVTSCLFVKVLRFWDPKSVVPYISSKYAAWVEHILRYSPIR